MGENPEKDGTIPEGWVSDVAEAAEGAAAEKPLRDAAREEGVSAEEKAILDRLANERAEQAMAAYAVEKGKNPIERLEGRMAALATELGAEDKPQDAEIIRKFLARFDRYRTMLGEGIRAIEEREVRRAGVGDLHFLSLRVPVSARLGKEGGVIFDRLGLATERDWFRSPAESADIIKERQERFGSEAIVEHFSPDAEAKFLRSIGVLASGEDRRDLRQAHERMVEALPQKERGEFTGRDAAKIVDLRFPTNIPGVCFEVIEDDVPYGKETLRGVKTGFFFTSSAEEYLPKR